MVSYLRIADGPFGPRSEEMFLFPPGYGMFLALVREIAGLPTIKPALYVQTFIDTGTLLLLSGIARKLFNARTALCAAFIYAVYYPALIYTGLLLSETLSLFLTTAFIYGIIKYVEKPRTSTLLLSTIVISYGILVRTNVALIFVVLIGYSFFLTRRLPKNTNLKIFTAFFFLSLLILLPWPLRNWHVTGQRPFISTNFGMNILQGNNEYADGRYISLQDIPQSQKSMLNGVDAVGQNVVATRLAKNFIRNYPAYELLWLMPEKARILFLEPYPNAYYPWDDGLDGHFGTHPFGPYVKFFLLPFSILFPLSMLGLTFKPKRFRLIPILSLLTLLAPLVMFHAGPRFRFPAESILVILAAAPIAVAWKYSKIYPLKWFFCAGGILMTIISIVYALSVLGPNKLLSPSNVNDSTVLEQMTNGLFVQNTSGENVSIPLCEIPVSPGREPYVLMRFEYRIETTRIGNWERSGQSPNFKLTYLDSEEKEVKRPYSPPRMLPANVQLSSRQESWGSAWRVIRLPAAARKLKIEYVNNLPGVVTIRNLSACGAVW